MTERRPNVGSQTAVNTTSFFLPPVKVRHIYTPVAGVALNVRKAKIQVMIQISSR